jgi:pimeloyl-ACP methyl ester carboxylesterase
MARWLRLTKAGGVAVGAVAAGVGSVLVAEKIAVGRVRLSPDPAAGEPFGQVRGRAVTVLANDGTPLHAEIDGPDDAPVTIVFSHGYTLSQDCWHYQRQALAGTARMVFWDQRGHGQSGRGARDRVSIARTGVDLAAVLAATVPDGGPVVLVGHSMGGMTIMALARQHPGLFGSQVIGTLLMSTAASDIDTAHWLPAPLRAVGRVTTRPVLRGAARGRAAALVERGRAAGGDLAFLSARYIAFGDARVSPATVDFVERIIRACPVDVVADFYLALERHDEKAALATLGQAPCVVLTGDRDRLVPWRQGRELADSIPGASLLVVPGAGHLVIMERPEAVNQAIITLLQTARLPVAARPEPDDAAVSGTVASGTAVSDSVVIDMVPGDKMAGNTAVIDPIASATGTDDPVGGGTL